RQREREAASFVGGWRLSPAKKPCLRDSPSLGHDVREPSGLPHVWLTSFLSALQGEDGQLIALTSRGGARVARRRHSVVDRDILLAVVHVGHRRRLKQIVRDAP